MRQTKIKSTFTVSIVIQSTSTLMDIFIHLNMPTCSVPLRLIFHRQYLQNTNRYSTFCIVSETPPSSLDRLSRHPDAPLSLTRLVRRISSHARQIRLAPTIAALRARWLPPFPPLPAEAEREEQKEEESVFAAFRQCIERNRC